MVYYSWRLTGIQWNENVKAFNCFYIAYGKFFALIVKPRTTVQHLERYCGADAGRIYQHALLCILGTA